MLVRVNIVPQDDKKPEVHYRPMFCWERETSLFKQYAIVEMQSLSELRHFAYECSALRPVSQNAEQPERPSAKKGNGRDTNAVAKSQQRSGL